MVGLEEIYAYQSTPEGLGKSFQECAEIVVQQKKLLHDLQAVTEVEYSRTDHLQQLKKELDDWKRSRRWRTSAQKAKRTQAIQILDNKISQLEAEIHA